MDLPNEILINIFEYSNVEDLKCITLASTKFYELVTTTTSINKKFKLKFSSKCDVIIIEALMNSGRYFENVSVPIPYHNENTPCKSSPIIDLMKKIGDRVKNIEFGKETTRMCSKPIFQILGTCPNIESLEISDRNFVSECFGECSKLPIGNFSRLKVVQIPFNMFLATMKHVSTLEKMIVYNFNRGESLEFIEILRNNQSALKSFIFPMYIHVEENLQV